MTTVGLPELFMAMRDTVAEGTEMNGFAFVAESIVPPCFIVMPDSIERASFRPTSKDVPFRVVVFAPAVVDSEGQLSLMEYLDFTDNRSIAAAIDRKPNLGLKGVDAAILRARPLGLEEYAAYQHYGGVCEGLAVITGGAS